MFWYAHLLFGVGVVSLLTADPVVLLLAAVLSVLPDLDKPFGHRSWFSHSISAAFLFSVVGLIASSLNLVYACAVLLAFSSHILLDFFTKSGVPLFHPWDKKSHGLRIVSAHNKKVSKSVALFGFLLLLYNLWQAYPIL